MVKRTLKLVGLQAFLIRLVNRLWAWSRSIKLLFGINRSPLKNTKCQKNKAISNQIEKKKVLDDEENEGKKKRVGGVVSTGKSYWVVGLVMRRVGEYRSDGSFDILGCFNNLIWFSFWVSKNSSQGEEESGGIEKEGLWVCYLPRKLISAFYRGKLDRCNFSDNLEVYYLVGSGWVGLQEPDQTLPWERKKVLLFLFIFFLVYSFWLIN